MVKGMGIVIILCGIAVMIQNMELLGLLIVLLGGGVFWFEGTFGGDK